ncbi:MAG: GAF and ANTAR domain-containing protein [Candidatus Margulisbacteria bacterium]|nr:GAF and ANTAR domain-containing protein [Candidatus Margulisiibacteriota bacterium]
MQRASNNDLLKALSKISQAITSEGYLDDILKLIVVVTAELMKSNICSLMLYDEESHVLKIKATQSISDEYIKKPPLKLGEGIAGKVAQTNKLMVIKDVTSEKDYKYRDIATKEGLKSLLSVPMAVKGRVIGVINCYTSEVHSFTKNEIHILTTIANQAAMAIENTNLILKSKLIQEELETRKKIERAKGIIQKDTNISEEDAYLKIKNYAMDHRISMQDVANLIITAEEIKSYKINK